MKKYFAILLFALIALIVKAQSIEEDILILKDGSIYRGKIIDSTHADKIKMECYDRNIYVINKLDIEEIKKQPADLNYSLNRFKSKNSINQLDIPYFNKGFKLSIETLYGLNISKGTSNNFNYSALLISAGYRFHKGLFWGLQSGINMLSHLKKMKVENQNMPDLFYFTRINTDVLPMRISTPLLFSIQQTLYYEKISSILALNLGYDLNLKRNYTKTYHETQYIAKYTITQNFNWNNSLFFNPEIKNIINLSKKLNLLASAGYVINNISFNIDQLYTIYFNNLSYSTTNTFRSTLQYRFIYLKIGLGF